MKIFHLPDLGEGLAEAEIREWYVKEGEVVKIDQPLVSMETAKAVVDVPSPYAGTIVKLYGKRNDIIQTHAPLVSFDIEESQGEKPKGSVVGALEESNHRLQEDEMIIGAAKTRVPAIKAMPTARVLAKEMNIDLNTVTPTGPQGLITPEDVKQLYAKKSSTLSLPGKTESLRGVRRTMAQAMAESHREVVPVTIIEDADISGLPPKSDITIQLLRAMVHAVKTEPALNAWFDGKTLERKLFTEVNVGLAVDSPEGLFVPVLHQVEQLNDDVLRAKVDEYKQGVLTRSIKPADMQSATITLSNFGTITGRYATPILIPPMVAILACGRMREAAIAKQGKIIAGRILPLSLTFDHRAVTGGEATRFLGAVIQVLSGG